MAEWLCSGLQSRLRRFDSGFSLHEYMNKDNFFNNLVNIFDDKDIKIDELSKEKYRNDWSTNFESDPVAIVFPQETSQVIDIIRLCNEFKQPVIGSGGRTGLSGGASALSDELIVSFDKMNSITDFDEVSKSVICQPGLITQNLQSFANDNNLYYPVDFSSSGSSQIGGNIATNAGGIRVIKYGLTSKYVSGLDVVTGNGDYLSDDKMLIKNATGPDLKNLFIGSEGIYGLTTSCRMLLLDKPLETNVILIGFDKLSSLDEIKKLLLGFDLEAIEFFTRNALNQVDNEFEDIEINQLNNNYYLIIDLHQQNNLNETLERIYKNELAQEIIISNTISQKESIWQYRLLISESISRLSPIKFDVAVTPKLVTRLINELELYFNNKEYFHLILFGHLGDGNLHINILENNDATKCNNNSLGIEDDIYDIVLNLNGTISAEHGIGINKVNAFMNYENKFKIDIMQNLKNHLDKNLILNPGKLIKN